MYVATMPQMHTLYMTYYSSLLASFSEISSGVSIIRSFRKESQFLAENLSRIDDANRVVWPCNIAPLWLSVRLEMLSAFVLLFVSLMVAAVEPENPGLAGFAIIQALYGSVLTSVLTKQMDLDAILDEVRKLYEYETLPEEGPALLETARP